MEDTGSLMALNSALLPIFGCVGPAAGLIGFVLVMLGISSRNPKMTKWGVGVLIFAALGIVISLIFAARSAR